MKIKRAPIEINYGYVIYTKETNEMVHYASKGDVAKALEISRPMLDKFLLLQNAPLTVLVGKNKSKTCTVYAL